MHFAYTNVLVGPATLVGVEQGRYNHALAAEFRAERAASGMTQAQLAEKSGIKLVTLQLLLTGNRPINVTQIVQLSQAFGIEPSVLVERAMARAERINAGQADG